MKLARELFVREKYGKAVEQLTAPSASGPTMPRRYF